MPKKKTHEEFVKEVFNLVGNKYAVVGKYTGSLNKIKMYHNNCNSYYDVQPSNFLFGQRCPICNKHKKTHDEFVQEIRAKFGNEYMILGEYINWKTKILIEHNECNYKWDVTPNNLLQGKSKCPNCSGKKPYSTEEFSKIISEITNGEYVVTGKYINNYTKITIKHLLCNYEWEAIPYDFKNNGNRCPRCQGKERYTDEDFKYKVKELTNGEIIPLENYTNNYTKIKFKHISCGHVFETQPTRIINEFQQCPECYVTFSKGEKRIKDYLIKNEIKYQQEYTFKDCFYINLLRFDFSIIKNNRLIALIEYDGKQHFEPSDFFGGESAFEETKIRDGIKNEYCRNKNIPLLRIPYWEFVNIEKVLDDFINDLKINI